MDQESKNTNFSFRKFSQEEREKNRAKGREILQVGPQASQKHSVPSKINNKNRKESTKLEPLNENMTQQRNPFPICVPLCEPQLSVPSSLGTLALSNLVCQLKAEKESGMQW